MKKFVIFISALILAFSLTACGEDTKESVIEDSLEFLSDVENFHCTTVTAMDLKMNESQVASVLSMDAKMDMESNCNHMTMYSNTNGEELSVEFYVDASSSPAKYYLGSGNRWVKMNQESLPTVDVTTNLYRDFEAYFDEFMINPDTVMEVTDIEGQECFMLSAPITIRSITMAKSFGIDGFISSLLGNDATEDMVTTMLSYLGPIDITVYISCDDYAPVGMVMDMQSALETMYTKLNATDVTVTEAYASSAYSDYNDSEVKIPENVRFAPDSSTISGSIN